MEAKQKRLSPVYVTIRAYGEYLVIEAVGKDLEKDREKYWWPANDKRFGSTIADTEKRLRVSKKALQLLDKVRRGNDDLGDVAWFRACDGKYVFSWFGPPKRVLHPEDCEADRDWSVWERECQIIKNTFSAAKKREIEQAIKELDEKET